MYLERIFNKHLKISSNEIITVPYKKHLLTVFLRFHFKKMTNSKQGL